MEGWAFRINWCPLVATLCHSLVQSKPVYHLLTWSFSNSRRAPLLLANVFIMAPFVFQSRPTQGAGLRSGSLVDSPLDTAGWQWGDVGCKFDWQLCGCAQGSCCRTPTGRLVSSASVRKMPVYTHVPPATREAASTPQQLCLFLVRDSTVHEK